jgi:hypothetical protein
MAYEQSKPVGCLATRDTSVALAVLALAAAMSLPTLAARRDLGWMPYRDQAFGYGFDYPTVIFKRADGDPTASLTDSKRKSGQVFRSDDGKAFLLTAAFENNARLDLVSYKQRIASTAYKDAKVEYERVAANFFVLSGVRGKDVFYERVTFTCGGRVVNVWTMTYPRAEGALYDRIVEEVARTFRPTDGAGCK